MNALLRDFKERLNRSFLEPVLEEMGVTVQVKEHAAGEYHWEMYHEMPEREDENRSLRKGKEILKELYRLQGHDELEVKDYRTLRYVPEKKGNYERRVYGHHQVSRGFAVSSVTTTSDASTVLRPVPWEPTMVS